jgi:hypothetical protein
MKMKRPAHISTLLIVIMAGVIFSGCAGTHIRRISGDEFMAKAEYIEALKSFDWMTYIGHSERRAYLEYGHPAGSDSRTTIFWTPLSELPNDIVRQLKSGKPPWTPYYSELTMRERTSASTSTNEPALLRITD